MRVAPAELEKFLFLKGGQYPQKAELPRRPRPMSAPAPEAFSAQAALAILGVKTSQELACVMASVGLAQNFAALRALSGEGIQRGHMELHAKNLAIASGATGEEADKIASRMISDNDISAKKAAELLTGMKKLQTTKKGKK